MFSPVSPPFRLRVSHHLDHAPFPHPAHRTGRAQLRHPALGQGSPVRDPRRLVGCGSVMASEASEPLNGVDRLAPISRLSAPSTMGLELGSLPSTGVTRLPRYYQPLRHPKRPGLALAGVRLSSRDSPLGASRVASDLPVQACRRPYPGGTPGACRVVRGNPLCLPGRWPSPYSNRVGTHIGWFRGLHGVHSRCGLPARRAARGGPLSRRLRRLRYLHRRSDSYRMERPVIRAGIAPAGDPRLGTAHCYRNPKE